MEKRINFEEQRLPLEPHPFPVRFFMGDMVRVQKDAENAGVSMSHVIRMIVREYYRP